MNFVALCLSAVLVTELALRLPFATLFHGLSRTVHKIRRVLGSRYISDHWKEKVILKYAIHLAKASLGFGGLLLILLISFVVINAIIAPSPIQELLILSMSGTGLLTIIVSSILFVLLRRRLARK